MCFEVAVRTIVADIVECRHHAVQAALWTADEEFILSTG